ncbi:MAG: adenylate/guanylate cyclase domain-containing protein [Aeoliella sp.]
MSDDFTRRQLEPLDGEAYAKLRDSQQGGPAPETLARWLEALGMLHRWTADREEFFSEAARFVVDPIGLDGAMILRRGSKLSAGAWEIVTSHSPKHGKDVPCEFGLVDQVTEAGVTLFHSIPGNGPSVVISPLFDAKGQVTGAIYGYRAIHEGNGRRGVRYLEAHLVELLAQSVSAGIARLAREAEAARQRAVYEQVFAPGIAQRMELDANALNGREREVTVLFADLRGFAQLCGQLTTRQAYELLNDVMDELTDAVMSHEGVLIDYYGDGLSAMWNAPVVQKNHSELACQAAIQMLERLPKVSERWRETLPTPLKLGIGIHAGPAQVGNIGSSQRLKYGPRGSTVNLASRIESATKLVGVPLVVTRAVADQLSDHFLRFRVCQANLPGIVESVDLFSLRPASTDERMLAAIEHYEQALNLYESGKLAQACVLLEGESDSPDLPAAFLARQIKKECSRCLGRRAGDEQPPGSAAIDLAVK